MIVMCLSYYSVTMKRHYNQGNLQKKVYLARVYISQISLEQQN